MTDGAHRPAASGSPVDPVLDLFDRRVTAADVCSPAFAVSAVDDAGDAARALAARGYAAAPVLPRHRSGPVSVFRAGDVATTGAPPATVADVAQPLPDAAVLRPDDPLPSVLEALRTHDLLVVLDGPGDGGGDGGDGLGVDGPAVVGVITGRDLDRRVVGLAVLGLLVRAEPQLDRLVAVAAGDDWELLLPPARRAKLAGVRPYLQRPDAQLSRLARLNLDDRMTLVRKLPGLRARLGFATTGAYRRFAEPVRDLRDVLAHGGGLLDATGDARTAIDLVTELRRVVDRIDACVAEDRATPSHKPPG